MFSHTEERVHPAKGKVKDLSVLIVSETPEFIVMARSMLDAVGMHVVGCLGPAQAPCLLDTKGFCALATHAAIAIVDSPRSGVFKHHTEEVPAGEYAERLAAIHPASLVLLCGAPIGGAGPSGEVTHVVSAHSALVTMCALGALRASSTYSNGESNRREADS